MGLLARTVRICGLQVSLLDEGKIAPISSRATHQGALAVNTIVKKGIIVYRDGLLSSYIYSVPSPASIIIVKVQQVMSESHESKKCARRQQTRRRKRAVS
jgi:hypothetical protein